MPLFMCGQCGCVENTALSNYWMQQQLAREQKREFFPGCSQCVTGEWHGQFPRKLADGYMKVKGDGPAAHIWAPHEVEKGGYFFSRGREFEPVKLPEGARV